MYDTYYTIGTVILPYNGREFMRWGTRHLHNPSRSIPKTYRSILIRQTPARL